MKYYSIWNLPNLSNPEIKINNDKFKLNIMCLYTQQNKPKIAQKPIRVWKVLDFYCGKYYTPFRRFNMKEGEWYYQTEKKFSVDRSPISKLFKIKKGLHSLKKRPYKNFPFGSMAVQMEIPKGAEYFESKTEICSDQLIWHWGAKVIKL